MYRRISLFIIAATLVALSAQAYAATYDVDPVHSRIGFGVRHMVISVVKGEFTKFSGTFEMDGKDAITGIKANIEVGSINTREKKRDGHLKSPDFFDTEMFPEITFVSKKIVRNAKNYTVTGDLTMKGVTKPFTLKGELLGKVVGFKGDHRVGFRAEGKINRKDFGISFHKLLEAGGLVVGDEVTITLDVEGVRRK